MIKFLAGSLLAAVLAAPAMAAEATQVLLGKVKSFHKTPKGDPDRITLDGGQEIRFPPHIGRKVAAVIEVGDEAKVQAEKRVSPKGDEHLQAVSITNVKSGQSVDCDAPPPKPPKDKQDRQPAPPDGPSLPEAAAKPKDELPAQRRVPHHERILAEVREIEDLLGVARPPEKEPGAGGKEHDGPPHEQVLAALRRLKVHVKKRLKAEHP